MKKGFWVIQMQTYCCTPLWMRSWERAALGDIGQHFPDSDEAYKGISSLSLLKRVGEILAENGFLIENIDSTVIAQKPKLLPYRPGMMENIADALGLERDRVSVKATTEEGLGFTGNGEGIGGPGRVPALHGGDYDRGPDGCGRLYGLSRLSERIKKRRRP